LNLEDAEGRVGILEVESKQRADFIATLNAEIEYERRLVD